MGDRGRHPRTPCLTALPRGPLPLRGPGIPPRASSMVRLRAQRAGGLSSDGALLAVPLGPRAGGPSWPRDVRAAGAEPLHVAVTDHVPRAVWVRAEVRVLRDEDAVEVIAHCGEMRAQDLGNAFPLFPHSGLEQALG